MTSTLLQQAVEALTRARTFVLNGVSLAEPADETLSVIEAAIAALDLAEAGHPQAEKLLDNLSQAKLVHEDVLPFAASPSPQDFTIPMMEDVHGLVCGGDGVPASDMDYGNNMSVEALPNGVTALAPGAPLEWYTRLATMALEAIEAGPNAMLLMNLEGIKDHLRAAKDGKWPTWAGAPAAGVAVDCQQTQCPRPTDGDPA